jgi:hypothetical protein
MVAVPKTQWGAPCHTGVLRPTSASSAVGSLDLNGLVNSIYLSETLKGSAKEQVDWTGSILDYAVLPSPVATQSFNTRQNLALQPFQKSAASR